MNAIVTFTVDGILCGLSVAVVREVLPMVALRPLPRQNPPLIGLLTLRGELIPVVSLRVWFGRADHPPNVLTRIMVVEGREGRIGFLVDEVHDVVPTEGWQPSPPPPDRLGGPSAYLSGLLGRDGVTISLLDLSPLLALSEATGRELTS